MFLTQYNSQTGFKQIGLGEEQLFPSSANKTVYFLRRPNLTCRKLGSETKWSFSREVFRINFAKKWLFTCAFKREVREHRNTVTWQFICIPISYLKIWESARSRMLGKLSVPLKMPISSDLNPIQTGGGAFDLKSSWRVHQHWRLNDNLVLTAMFFLICIFPIKTFVFYFKLLNYYITLDWVIFYQIFDNCSCNTGFLVTNWI